MKKITSIVMFFALMLGAVTLSAQKPFAGIIQYETSVEGIDDPNVQAAMAGITTEYMVMGNNMKIVTQQSGVGSIQITNGDYNLLYTIVDISAYNMGKYYKETKADELKELFSTKKYDYGYTKESREIAGYTCYKVKGTLTDLETDEEETIVYWVTNDLNVGENINFATAPGLKGFPLCTETHISNGDMDFTLIQTATSVKPDKKIKASNFFRPSDATPFDEMPADIKAQLGLGDDEE